MANEQKQQVFFVKTGDRERGPFSSKQLKQLARDGKITSESFIRDSSGSWIAAGKVKGIRELIAPIDSEANTASDDSQLRLMELSGKNQTPISRRIVIIGGAIAGALVLLGFGLANLTSRSGDENAVETAVKSNEENSANSISPESVLKRFERLLADVLRMNQSKRSDVGTAWRISDLAYDVKKTESLSSPYTANAKFLTDAGESNEKVWELTYAFQGDKWRLVAIRAHHPLYMKNPKSYGGSYPTDYFKPSKRDFEFLASTDDEKQSAPWDESGVPLDMDLFSGL